MCLFKKTLLLYYWLKAVPYLRNMSTSISIDTPEPVLNLKKKKKYLQKLLLLEYLLFYLEDFYL